MQIAFYLERMTNPSLTVKCRTGDVPPDNSVTSPIDLLQTIALILLTVVPKILNISLGSKVVPYFVVPNN